ncbi:10415_t:CDS:2 [Racocetra fulgida]|uniref:10415_t:CDS:1 n=1 Tax=Racocetra fulgida TaxID=60492 RepID=A0A9N8ZN66_9GLOM|nr:10415_t:CDS:2 [Racocetra fulgida]
MEYANGGNLREFIKTNNHLLNWDKRLELACQITKGLGYLHSEKIIHRDLHDKNIVIHDGKAKITDFGNAISINTQTNIHDSLFGMIPFVAPELLKHVKSDNIPYCKKTDIYSLGMIFWELSSGRPPFEDQLKISIAIKLVQGFREDDKYGTPEYRNLYIKCWNADPYERPDIEEVHKLLEEIVNSKILPEIDPRTINPDARESLLELDERDSVIENSTIEENTIEVKPKEIIVYKGTEVSRLYPFKEGKCDCIRGVHGAVLSECSFLIDITVGQNSVYSSDILVEPSQREDPNPRMVVEIGKRNLLIV